MLGTSATLLSVRIGCKEASTNQEAYNTSRGLGAANYVTGFSRLGNIIAKRITLLSEWGLIRLSDERKVARKKYVRAYFLQLVLLVFGRFYNR